MMRGARRSERNWWAHAGLAASIATALLAGSVQAQSPADSAWVSGDLDLAEQLYQREIEADATNTQALHRLGLIRGWSERYDQAIESFERLLEVDPTNVEAAIERAKVLSWSQRFAESSEAFREVLDRNPERTDARLGLARVLSWDRRFTESETVFGEILADEPSHAEALAGYARLAAWDGRLSDAERRWRAALDHHPEDVAMMVGYSQTLRWQGRPASALSWITRAEEIAPEDPAVQEEAKWTRVAVAPRFGPRAIYESDSDGNRMATFMVDQSIWVTPMAAINVSGYARTADQVTLGFGETAYAGRVEVRTRLDNGWQVNGAASAHRLGLDASETDFGGSVRVSSPTHLPARGTALLWRRPLDVTAALIRDAVMIDEAHVSGSIGTIARGQFDAELSLARFTGTEESTRRWAGLSASRRLSRAWVGKATVRYFGFSEEVADPYFDPTFYGSVELGADWTQTWGAWRLSLGAFPGIQRIDRDDTVTTGGTITTRGRLSYEFAPGRVIQLYGGFATTGMQSFSTGAADYRYVHVGLAAGWAF